ncbi:Cobalamin biosynthesis protein CbiB [Geobacillus sp. BCO2]|nr:Cobalamin biosynthesis protein CbiB [Geobacillus sp. BCO2]
MTHLLAMTLALLLDALLGDPRWLPHPVRGMGTLIAWLDRRWNQGTKRRAKGAAAVAVVLAAVYGLSALVVYVATRCPCTWGWRSRRRSFSPPLRPKASLKRLRMCAGRLKRAIFPRRGGRCR